MSIPNNLRKFNDKQIRKHFFIDFEVLAKQLNPTSIVDVMFGCFTGSYISEYLSGSLGSSQTLVSEM